MLIFALTLFAMLWMAHLLSTGLAIFRITRQPASDNGLTDRGISLIRPVCGLDQHDALTLRSSFFLTHPRYEVIFCCAADKDPVVPVIKDLIGGAPAVDAKLLIGDDRTTANPKLNNLIKGWASAEYPWIVLCDSNVLLPPDYLAHLSSALREDTGLICSPPAGCLPQGFASEIECAFLNSYQARWQLAADSVGLGFAQGKSMLWKRALLDEAGGLIALGSEMAEDAAATKLVRRKGLRVRLVDRPFPQPLGYRSATQVWNRQLRWARLRRASFAGYFAPEIFTGVVPAAMVLVWLADMIGADLSLATAAFLSAWYLPEAMLTRSAGWHFSRWTPLAWVARDCLIPVIWIAAWLGDEFSWRGTAMTVAPAKACSEIHP